MIFCPHGDYTLLDRKQMKDVMQTRTSYNSKCHKTRQWKGEWMRETEEGGWGYFTQGGQSEKAFPRLHLSWEHPKVWGRTTQAEGTADTVPLGSSTAEHNKLGRQWWQRGLEVRQGHPMQPCKPRSGTSDCVPPAKESQESTRSYYFKYKWTDELSKHNTLRTDHVRR